MKRPVRKEDFNKSQICIIDVAKRFNEQFPSSYFVSPLRKGITRADGRVSITFVLTTETGEQVALLQSGRNSAAPLTPLFYAESLDEMDVQDNDLSTTIVQTVEKLSQTLQGKYRANQANIFTIARFTQSISDDGKDDLAHLNIINLMPCFSHDLADIAKELAANLKTRIYTVPVKSLLNLSTDTPTVECVDVISGLSEDKPINLSPFNTIMQTTEIDSKPVNVEEAFKKQLHHQNLARPCQYLSTDFITDINQFLERYKISVEHCAVFEETLLKMCGIEIQPTESRNYSIKEYPALRGLNFSVAHKKADELKTIKKQLIKFLNDKYGDNVIMPDGGNASTPNKAIFYLYYHSLMEHILPEWKAFFQSHVSDETKRLYQRICRNYLVEQDQAAAAARAGLFAAAANSEPLYAAAASAASVQMSQTPTTSTVETVFKQACASTFGLMAGEDYKIVLARKLIHYAQCQHVPVDERPLIDCEQLEANYDVTNDWFTLKFIYGRFNEDDLKKMAAFYTNHFEGMQVTHFSGNPTSLSMPASVIQQKVLPYLSEMSAIPDTIENPNEPFFMRIK